LRNATLAAPTRILQVLLIPILAISSAWAGSKFQVVHTFTGGTDGAYPSSPLLDRSGTLYGVTPDGGSLTGCNSYGCGTAFKLLQEDGHWKEYDFYSFSAATNGDYPAPIGALAPDSRGDLYGIQAEAGDPTCNCGGVYQLTLSDGIWTQNILHNFTGGGSGDGAYPASGLVQDAAGNFYGTTEGGGVNMNGTIFELTQNTDGTWAYAVIYEFGATSSNDAEIPYGPLTIDSSGNLYGTSESGGEYGYGAVFRLSPNGAAWTEAVLFNFTLDYGSYPEPYGVVLDGVGNLYGVTLDGGAYAVGTIYKLTSAVGFWNRTVLHTFSGSGDGAYPYGGLTIGPTGVLYGTTGYGGSYGYGNAYEFALTNGKWKQTVLHQFTNSTDGAHPLAGVILDQLGNVYGTTQQGGAAGFGVAFEITP
jgi:uncharacterized repeat protein (TIGR03803 family)